MKFLRALADICGPAADAARYYYSMEAGTS